MRAMVFGATGLLGQKLVRELKGDQLVALSSRDVDLRDPAGVLQVVRDSAPDWIVLAAAYTDVDGCESNRELAFQVNSQGAINVALAAQAAGARLMFISTDYVFDGAKETPYEPYDRKNPINVYGDSKARAEAALTEILPDVCIVRTSWLYGTGGKCFPATILRLAEGGKEISIVNDQRGCPTLTEDLARALVELCRKSARGIIHATNSGNCTWYELGLEIAAIRGLKTSMKPVTSAEFPRPARRPAYSILSGTSLAQYGIHMREWKEALREYLGAQVNV